MEKGYDADKKVSGIKRHIAVDTQGLPHALAVTTADVTDRKGCLLALKRGRDNLGTVQKILADGLHGQGICFVGTGVDWYGGRDCQTKRIAPFCSIAEAVGSRTQLFLVGKE